MPRLSLFQNHKNKNYHYIDKMVYQQFQIGGTDLIFHKYLGVSDGAGGNLGTAAIQDLLLLENRDRKYDTDVYSIRGHFQLQDLDFNLTQFALFLQSDTLFATVHINNSIDTLGRKIMSGDVIEIPVLADEHALNDFATAIKRFYVVDSVTRAAEGYSATWYPHLYKLKLVPIVDSQEYKDILNTPLSIDDNDKFMGDLNTSTIYYPSQIVRINGDLYTVKDSIGVNGGTIPNGDFSNLTPYQDNTLKDLMSTYSKELAINEGILAEADKNVKRSGFDISNYYSLAVDPETGLPVITSADMTIMNIATDNVDVSHSFGRAIRDGYTGYLLGPAMPPNGAPFGYGLTFPDNPQTLDYFLRTDLLPNRLFVYKNGKWVKYMDDIRMTLTNSDLEGAVDKGPWSPSVQYSPKDLVHYNFKTFVASGLPNNLNQNPEISSGFWYENIQSLRKSFVNNVSKLYSEPLVHDSIRVSDNYVYNSMDIDNHTLSFTRHDTYATVQTNILYHSSYAVGATIDGLNVAVSGSRSVNGNIAFDVLQPLEINSLLNWTVYGKSQDQRQALSTVLRDKTRFKPLADN